MKALFCSISVLLASAGPLVPPPVSTPIAGEYVEARTASVFAGACHYNGELVTTGRDAVLAWRFTSGSWNGTDLSGLRAVAAVSSDANLGQERAARKAELVVDSGASEAQTAALAGLLRETCGRRLGEVVAVRRAPITFTRVGRAFSVEARDFASLSVRPMPNNECCAQPNLVWYEPLMPLADRKVGYAQRAAYTAGTIGDPWQREGENSAFYGAFSF